MMDQTLFDFTIAATMITVVAVLFGLFRRSENKASVWRMLTMMTRMRIDPRISTDANPRFKAIMRGARRRCARCPNEGYCERWLAGEVEGPNTFCANARVFHDLADSTT